MLSGRGKSLKHILLSSSSFTFKTPTFSHQNTYLYSQVQTYTDCKQKWIKDKYLDSFESIHTSFELKPIIALKNMMVSSSQDDDYSIPISVVRDMYSVLDLRYGMKVSNFMRQYPSFFEEFVRPKSNLPWFNLTEKAIALHNEEQLVYQESKFDLIDRLKKFILMSAGVEKKLPMKIIEQMQWYLGFPDEFLKQPEKHLDGIFRLVDMEDGSKGLAIDSNEKEAVISFIQASYMNRSLQRRKRGKNIAYPVMQANCMKRGVYSGEKGQSIPFHLFPSKGVRLKRKICDWLAEFQKLPYVSPYDNVLLLQLNSNLPRVYPNEDVLVLHPNSDIREKHLVGMLHELLSLFVEHSARRKAFIMLTKYFGFPQKVYKAFERHPHMFYISTKRRNRTVLLKEAFHYSSRIDTHPLARVRRKYVRLLEESKLILESGTRRVVTRSSKSSVDINIRDLDPTEGEEF